MILCKEEFGKKIDKSIFPGIQGGPLMHVISAKAVSFGEVLTGEFKQYAQQVITNAKRLGGFYSKNKCRISRGCSDCRRNIRWFNRGQCDD